MTKIAIIGSGFSSAHVAALTQIPSVEIKAVCSRNESTGNELIKQSCMASARYYDFDDHLKMLRTEQLDAVYVSLPPFLHGELEIACSDYVPALFQEKPVGLDLDTTSRMASAFDKAGTLVSVGYMNRYRATLQKAKSYFQNDPAVLFNAGWCGTMPPPYWWRRRELSGGQLTEQCTHLIDAVRFLSGEISEVQAMSTRGFITGVEDFGVDDAMVMNFLLESGAVGSVQTSCFAKPQTGGSMGVHLTAASKEKTYRFSKHSFELQISHSEEQTENIESTDDPILLENKAFVKAIESGDQSDILSPFCDAVKTLKVSLAADLSIREKRSVRLSELGS